MNWKKREPKNEKSLIEQLNSKTQSLALFCARFSLYLSPFPTSASVCHFLFGLYTSFSTANLVHYQTTGAFSFSFVTTLPRRGSASLAASVAENWRHGAHRACLNAAARAKTAE